MQNRKSLKSKFYQEIKKVNNLIHAKETIIEEKNLKERKILADKVGLQIKEHKE